MSIELYSELKTHVYSHQGYSLFYIKKKLQTFLSPFLYIYIHINYEGKILTRFSSQSMVRNGIQKNSRGWPKMFILTKISHQHLFSLHSEAHQQGWFSCQISLRLLQDRYPLYWLQQFHSYLYFLCSFPSDASLLELIDKWWQLFN